MKSGIIVRKSSCYAYPRKQKNRCNTIQRFALCANIEDTHQKRAKHAPNEDTHQKRAKHAPNEDINKCKPLIYKCI